METILLERLAEIEARLEALEHGQRSAPTASGAVHEPFWVLEELERQKVDGVLFAGRVTSSETETVQWQSALSTAVITAQEWDTAAPVFAALGHPARLRLLKAILTGQTHTAELGRLDKVGSTGQLYHHLRELVAAGWLRSAGRSQHRIPTERVVPLLTMLAATESLESIVSTAS